MLSRIALKSKLIVNPTQFKALRLFATSTKLDSGKRYPHEAPERDAINFPAPRIATNSAPVRLGFIPHEWFQALYEKTGATGPYVLFWGAIATILSKEYYVYWVDTAEHLVFFTFVILAHKLAGPKLGAFLDKEVEKKDKEIKDSFEAGVKGIDAQLSALEAQNSLPEANKILHEAKRENVGLQLEADYRKRLTQVHNEVKKRVDYHLSIQNAVRRVEKQEMVNYILGEVNKSVGAAQEKEVFQLCLNQLKALAQKNAASI